MKILVTGFDPFGSDKINPAIEAVKKLPDTIKGAKIIKLEIPTVFNKSAQVVHQAIVKEQPDYVLNVGQAGGRSALTPERVAININDGRIPAKAIRAAGLPAIVSNTAGTYVCNHIFYQVQYMRTKEFPKLKAGFIHIPFLPEQVITRPNQPSMALADIVKGLTAAIGAIVERDGQSDIKAVEGQNH